MSDQHVNKHMQQYGRQLVMPFFDAELCSEIDALAHEIIGSGQLPAYEYTHHTNIYFYDDIILKIPQLTLLRAACTTPMVGVPLLAFVPPHRYMGYHVDGYGSACKLMLPILPHADTQLFFRSDINSQDAHSLDTKRFRPLIFDGDQLHGGINTGNHWRANLQFMFSEPFHVIDSLVQKDQLFRGISCRAIDLPAPENA